MNLLESSEWNVEFQFLFYFVLFIKMKNELNDFLKTLIVYVIVHLQISLIKYEKVKAS